MQDTQILYSKFQTSVQALHAYFLGAQFLQILHKKWKFMKGKKYSIAAEDMDNSYREIWTSEHKHIQIIERINMRSKENVQRLH